MIENYIHDQCIKCDIASKPAENVPDQSLRFCPKCGEVWFEDLNEPPKEIIHEP